MSARNPVLLYEVSINIGVYKTMYSIAANNLVPHTKLIRAHEEEGITSYLESHCIAKPQARMFINLCMCNNIDFSASHHVNYSLPELYNIFTISHSLH